MAKKPPKPAPRGRYHHGDLRTALLAAAAELVRQDGAASFSLREAARRVGVDPAASYRHFRDRGEVLLALAQQGFEALAADIAKALTAAGVVEPARALQVMGKSYVRFALAHPAEFRVMFGESGTTAQDPRLRLPTIPRTAYEQLEDRVGAWNREGKHGLDVTLCARALWSGVHGLARLLLDGALVLDEAEADALVETLIESLLRGLPKPEAAPKPRRK
jgi:AcrR family transcriptional regulator